MMIPRHLKVSATLVCVLTSSLAVAKRQTTKPVPSNNAPQADKSAVALTPEKAMTLAEQGRCREAIAVLRKAVSAASSKEDRKRAGVLGLRCAMAADDRLVAGKCSAN